MPNIKTSSHITFFNLDKIPPLRSDIKKGIFARNKMSGDWVKIPTSYYEVSSSTYDTWSHTTDFPNFSKYPEKYNDLVAAKEILKNDRYGTDYNSIGKAIYLIKRFLETHAK